MKMLNLPKKPLARAMYASLFMSGGTLFFLGLSTQGFNPLNIDSIALIDVAIFLLIAWRIYAMSRIAAVAGLIFYLLSQLVLIADFGFTMSIIPILITLTFIHSVRGTFAYQKFKEQEVEEKNLTSKTVQDRQK